MNKKGIFGLIAAGLTAGAAGACYGVVRKVYKDTYKRVTLSEFTDQLRYKDVADKYPRRGISFISGSNRLQGYIYGENTSGDMIVMAHGLYCSQEIYLGTICALVDRGWMVFAYDNTGVCESEGKDSRGLIQAVLDLHAALTFIESEPELSTRRKFLFGHSQGGYAVCAVLNFDHDIAGVVSISGFTTPYKVQSEHGKHMFGGKAVITFPFIAFEERRRFGKYARLSSIDGINRSDIPVLIMHGVNDDFVEYDKSGIISHKAEITNPNVTYMDLDYTERNGHSDILASLEGDRIIKKRDKWLEKLMKLYKVKDANKLPDEVLAEVYEGTDKVIASGCNDELYDAVDKYLRGL